MQCDALFCWVLFIFSVSVSTPIQSIHSAQELDWSTLNLQEKISSDLLSLGRDAYQCANQIYVVVKN